MPRSLLEILTQPNPRLDSQSVPAGGNTTGNGWVAVTGWRRWSEFNYENLLSVYKSHLFSDWRHPPSVDNPSGFDQEIRDERSMDLFLAKYIWPHVNGALAEVSSCRNSSIESLYLAPGSWCHGDEDPDWGLVSRERRDEAKFWNILPGDTKLSAKWRSDMRKSESEYLRRQWSLPVSQVSTYGVEGGCRYGFIITDEELVVLRFRKESTGPGIASTRSRRTASQLHQRVVSGGTDISSVIESMSQLSYGAQSYNDNEYPQHELLPPEYARIPWSSYGKGRLSIKLSLFCLCLMASKATGIETSYPPFDSWRKESRHKFVHNISGFTAKELPRHANICNSWGKADDIAESAEDSEMEHFATGGDMAEEYHDEVDAAGPSVAEQSPSYPGQPRRQAIGVEVKNKDNKLVFYDSKGKKKSTKRSEWTETEGGWLYEGEKHLYFTAKLP